MSEDDAQLDDKLYDLFVIACLLVRDVDPSRIVTAALPPAGWSVAGGLLPPPAQSATHHPARTAEQGPDQRKNCSRHCTRVGIAGAHGGRSGGYLRAFCHACAHKQADVGGKHAGLRPHYWTGRLSALSHRGWRGLCSGGRSALSRAHDRKTLRRHGAVPVAQASRARGVTVGTRVRPRANPLRMGGDVNVCCTSF